MDTVSFGEDQKNKEGMMPLSEPSFVHEEVDHIKQKIENRKAKRKRLKVILGGLIGSIFVLTGITAYSQYKLYKLTREELNVGAQLTSGGEGIPMTGEEIVKALRKHILLPDGDPQIAEVQDANKIKETQAFFKDSQNGDFIIVYPTMIYIYRPGADIVIAASDISGAGQEKP